jgi:hypothetical protein
VLTNCVVTMRLTTLTGRDKVLIWPRPTPAVGGRLACRGRPVLARIAAGSHDPSGGGLIQVGEEQAWVDQTWDGCVEDDPVQVSPIDRGSRAEKKFCGDRAADLGNRTDAGCTLPHECSEVTRLDDNRA